MTKNELLKFIDGPLSALLSKKISYHQFLHLLHFEFGIDMDKEEFFPRLFNIVVRPDDPLCESWSPCDSGDVCVKFYYSALNNVGKDAWMKSAKESSNMTDEQLNEIWDSAGVKHD